MFSLMLSSEDFPSPMETSEPEGAGSSRPPMIRAPTSQSIFPPSQASHSFLQPLPQPPSSASMRSVSLVPDQKGIFSAAPGLPWSSSLADSKLENPLKRCDDDVQFVSEKPVKRRRLESSATSNPADAQPQRMPTCQTCPALSHVASGPVQGEDESSGPPVCSSMHLANAVSGHTPKPAGLEPTAGVTSLPSLENYVFPTSLPEDRDTCRKDSPQLSPKQKLDMEPPNRLHSVNPQAVYFPEKSQGSQREGAASGIGADPKPKGPENETEPSFAQSNQSQLPGGNAEPTDVLATQQMPPPDSNTAPARTGSGHNRETPNTEISTKAGLVINGTPPHNQSAARDSVYKQERQSPTEPPTTTPPGRHSGPLASSPSGTQPQHTPAADPPPALDASLPSQENLMAGKPQPCSGGTSSANIRTHEPGRLEDSSPPSVPKTAPQPPVTLSAPAESQVPRRAPSQIQAQSVTGQQPQIYPQGHNQGQHRAGLHTPGSGSSKAHCRICAARRQQAALQRAALSGNGGQTLVQGALSPGTVASHAQAQAPNSAPYNVVFLPTPVQGSNRPAGAQFKPSSNPPNANVGMMGMPSHPYMVQNPQQGMMAASSLPLQASRGPRPSMTSQPPQSRPEQRISPQKNARPWKYAHQEPSPGKHIIVDIADTAMEVFPFDHVAQRHNVPVDKIRNIFEAVVAIPFLRMPADKRRAGKIGQERVRNYVNAKKEVEKARAAEGREGSHVSVYDIAAAMGPEEQPPKVSKESAPGFRTPW
ncbi:hypothetical protein VUR80DRAFT_680 [Thermomyces stellatus]